MSGRRGARDVVRGAGLGIGVAWAVEALGQRRRGQGTDDAVVLRLLRDPADAEQLVAAGTPAATGHQDEIRLPAGDHTLGTGSSCDVRLADDGVRPQHAVLHVRSDGSWVEGLDGARVVVDGRTAARHGLADGSRLRLGTARFGVRTSTGDGSAPLRGGLGGRAGSAALSWVFVAVALLGMLGLAAAVVLSLAWLAAASVVVGLLSLVVARKARVMQVATVSQDLGRVGEG